MSHKQAANQSLLGEKKRYRISWLRKECFGTAWNLKIRLGISVSDYLWLREECCDAVTMYGMYKNCNVNYRFIVWLFCIRISWSVQWTLWQMLQLPQVKHRVVCGLLLNWNRWTCLGKHLLMHQLNYCTHCTRRVISLFGLVLSLSGIVATNTHRPQGVLIIGIYMSSNICYLLLLHLSRKQLCRQIGSQTSSRAIFTKLS